jgi:hypothetical protein
METGERAVERWVVRASLETLANELSLLGFWQKRRKKHHSNNLTKELLKNKKLLNLLSNS